MFTTNRYTYRYGNEYDPMDCTTKCFDTYKKAKAYADKYATGIKFAGVEVEDESGKTVYEITSDIKVFEY